jgi:hypothetical protein
LYKLELTSIDAPVCALSLCAGGPRATLGAGPRRDSDGQPACEMCGTRLSKVKHHRPHGVGRKCAPRCKPQKRSADDSREIGMVVPPAQPTKKQRRTRSDPGQQQTLNTPTLTRTKRVRATKPNPPRPVASKKTRSEAEISALLDATHARRMAILEAEAKATSSLPL